MDIRDEGALIPRKLVEAAFRNLWIVLTPLVLLPGLVMVLTRTTPTYHSGATIWTQTLDGVQTTGLNSNANPYQTAAANQVQVLNDLLATRTFRADIAIAARLVDPAASDREMSDAAIYVGQSISVAAIGTNLVGLAVATPSAEDSYAIAVAFINVYNERATEQSAKDSQAKIDYYTDQLTIAQAELSTRLTAINAYAAAHPTVVDPTAKVYDPEYERLKAAFDQQNVLVTDLGSKKIDAELEQQSSQSTLAAMFRVQDPPSVAATPDAVSMTKKLGLPIAAFIFGVFLSVAYLYIVYRLDQTIRSASDLESLGVPLLGYVPEIQKGRGSRAWEYTPFGWLMQHRQKGYARKVAASIASIKVQQGGA